MTFWARASSLSLSSPIRSVGFSKSSARLCVLNLATRHKMAQNQPDQNQIGVAAELAQTKNHDLIWEIFSKIYQNVEGTTHQDNGMAGGRKIKWITDQLQQGNMISILFQQSSFSNKLVQPNLAPRFEWIIDLSRHAGQNKVSRGKMTLTCLSSAEKFNVTISMFFGGSSRIGFPSWYII